MASGRLFLGTRAGTRTGPRYVKIWGLYCIYPKSGAWVVDVGVTVTLNE